MKCLGLVCLVFGLIVIIICMCTEFSMVLNVQNILFFFPLVTHLEIVFNLECRSLFVFYVCIWHCAGRGFSWCIL